MTDKVHRVVYFYCVEKIVDVVPELFESIPGLVIGSAGVRLATLREPQHSVAVFGQGPE
jgi:hypothetical protein